MTAFRGKWIVGGILGLLVALGAFSVWNKETPKPHSEEEQTGSPNSDISLNAKPLAPAPVATPPPPPGGTPVNNTTGGLVVAPTTVFTAPWGKAPGQFGMAPGNESSPEMPMAFGMDHNGGLFVLDQMNSRLQTFSPTGAFEKEVPLPSPRYQDIVMKEDGLWALQRFPELEIFDVGSGKKITLDPKKIPAPLNQNGTVTALNYQNGQPYLEKDHGTLYRVGESGPAALPGRPLGDGLYIVARFQDKLKGSFYVSALDQNNAIVWQVPLKTALVMEDIRAVEIQEKQKIVVVTYSYQENPKTFEIEKSVLEAFVISAQGQLQKNLTLQKHPEEMSEYDNFKPYSLSPQGDLLQMIATKKGLKIVKYAL